MSTQWKLMPFPATEKMIEAAFDAGVEDPMRMTSSLYKAMWEAAPAAPAAEPVAAHRQFVSDFLRVYRAYAADDWDIEFVALARSASALAQPESDERSPAPKACQPDTLVNGGALRMVLNALRRGTPVQQEMADELEKTVEPAGELARLKAENERLRANAERYRCWRAAYVQASETPAEDPIKLLADLADAWTEAAVDSAIDAARAEGEAK